jgi:hypothetical protein
LGLPDETSLEGIRNMGKDQASSFFIGPSPDLVKDVSFKLRVDDAIELTPYSSGIIAVIGAEEEDAVLFFFSGRVHMDQARYGDLVWTIAKDPDRPLAIIDVG